MGQYRYESWELLLAVLSKISQIHPTVLVHSVLPFFLVLLSYLSYFRLLGHFVDRKYLPIGMIFLSMFHIFGAYSEQSQGVFLLTRIWQGKSLLLHLLLPYFISLLLDSMKSNHWSLLIRLVAVCLAGIALNPIAVYILAIPLVSFVFMNFILHQPFRKKNLLPLLSLLVLIGYGIAIKIGIQDSEVYAQGVSGQVFDPIHKWIEFMGTAPLLFLGYIGIMVYTVNEERQ